jgi:hypothetical protein
MQRSVAAMQQFVSSFAELSDLSTRLHAPVLGGAGTTEQLPVRLLRAIPGTLHLRRGGASTADFLSRLPCVSAAGLAAPAAERLVRPELAAAIAQLAAGIAALSAGFRRDPAATQRPLAAAAAGSTQQLRHYSQVTCGRLDLA